MDDAEIVREEQERGRKQVEDLAHRVACYCEPPNLAEDAASLIRAMMRQRDADIQQIDRLTAEIVWLNAERELVARKWPDGCVHPNQCSWRECRFRPTSPGSCPYALRAAQ